MFQLLLRQHYVTRQVYHQQTQHDWRDDRRPVNSHTAPRWVPNKRYRSSAWRAFFFICFCWAAPLYCKKIYIFLLHLFILLSSHHICSLFLSPSIFVLSFLLFPFFLFWFPIIPTSSSVLPLFMSLFPYSLTPSFRLPLSPLLYNYIFPLLLYAHLGPPFLCLFVIFYPLPFVFFSSFYLISSLFPYTFPFSLLYFFVLILITSPFPPLPYCII